MLDNLRVRFAGHVVTRHGKELRPQIRVICQLAVESKAEPFPLAAVVPLERLGIAAVVGAASGVADVANRRPAGVLPHTGLALRGMVQAKRLDDAAELLI